MNRTGKIFGNNYYQKPWGRPFPSLIYSLLHLVHTKGSFDAQMRRNRKPSRRKFFYIHKTVVGYIRRPVLIPRTISKFDVAKNFGLQNNVRGRAFWNKSKLMAAPIENFNFGNFAKFVNFAPTPFTAPFDAPSRLTWTHPGQLQQGHRKLTVSSVHSSSSSSGG